MHSLCRSREPCRWSASIPTSYPQCQTPAFPLQLAAAHRHIAEDVTSDGQRWISDTVVNGASALRMMVISYLTEERHLDALQAAMLRVKLSYVESWIEARQAAARRYDSLIDEHHLGHFLQRPVVRTNRRHVFNQYVIRVANNQRDLLMRITY